MKKSKRDTIGAGPEAVVRIMKVVREIKPVLKREVEPLLKGRGPMIQSAALADLLATWLAGFRPDLREKFLEMHIGLVRALVPENEKEIFGEHGWAGDVCNNARMDVRLINMTDKPIEIEDGRGGYLILPPGIPTDYPGEIAGADLRRLLREQKVIIEDVPPGQPPIEHD